MTVDSECSLTISPLAMRGPGNTELWPDTAPSREPLDAAIGALRGEINLWSGEARHAVGLACATTQAVMDN